MAGLEPALRALADGGIIVYPTDTLLGFGVRAGDRSAVARLRALKDRPSGMPVSVVVSSTEEVEALADLSPMARRFVRTHLPGPYTVLVTPTPRGRARVAPEILGPAGRLGFRVPDHPLARELARRAGPITATSANPHGRPPCRTVPAARRAFGGAVAVYLSGPPRPSGVPSQLIDLAHGTPRAVPRR